MFIVTFTTRYKAVVAEGLPTCILDEGTHTP